MTDRLSWRRTWGDRPNDYEHREGKSFARIYKTTIYDPEKAWQWTVSIWAHPSTLNEYGYAASKQEAADQATEAWWRRKAKASE